MQEPYRKGVLCSLMYCSILFITVAAVCSSLGLVRRRDVLLGVSLSWMMPESGEDEDPLFMSIELGYKTGCLSMIPDVAGQGDSWSIQSWWLQLPYALFLWKAQCAHIMDFAPWDAPYIFPWICKTSFTLHELWWCGNRILASIYGPIPHLDPLPFPFPFPVPCDYGWGHSLRLLWRLQVMIYEVAIYSLIGKLHLHIQGYVGEADFYIMPSEGW